MAEVTEAAIKSAKFYKHVVQSVEKFIQKVSEYIAVHMCSVHVLIVLQYSYSSYNTVVKMG